MISTEKANEILSIRETINTIEEFVKEKREKFEQSIVSEKESLQKLNEEKNRLEKEFIELMKKENIGSFKTENNSITCSKKISLKIDNEQELQDYILENANELKSYVKDTIKSKDELLDKIAPRKLTATSVGFLSERFYDITGEPLPGMIKNQTDYLTIKKLNV